MRERDISLHLVVTWPIFLIGSENNPRLMRFALILSHARKWPTHSIAAASTFGRTVSTWAILRQRSDPGLHLIANRNGSLAISPRRRISSLDGLIVRLLKCQRLHEVTRFTNIGRVAQGRPGGVPRDQGLSNRFGCGI